MCCVSSFIETTTPPTFIPFDSIWYITAPGALKLFSISSSDGIGPASTEPNSSITATENDSCKSF